MFCSAVTSSMLNASKLSAAVVCMTDVGSILVSSLGWMKIWKRDSAGNIDSLPPRNWVTGISLQTVVHIDLSLLGLLHQQGSPVGSLLTHSTMWPLDVIFSSLRFLLMWGFEGQGLRALSCLEIYGRWDEGAGDNEREAHDWGCAPHTSIPVKSRRERFQS